MTDSTWWSTQDEQSAHSTPGVSPGKRNPTLSSTPARVVTAVMCLVTAFVVAASGYVTLFGAGRFDVTVGPYGSVAHIPTTEAVVGGCGYIFMFDPDPTAYGVFDPADITPQASGRIRVPRAPMVVPVYGYMSEQPAQPGFYGVEDDTPGHQQILRAMWDGVTVVWYDTRVGADDLGVVKRWVDANDAIGVPWTNHTLGLPSTLKGNDIPDERRFAFSTWGVSQSCLVFSDFIASTFLERAQPHSEAIRRTVEPPSAHVNEEGKLAPIYPKY